MRKNVCNAAERQLNYHSQKEFRSISAISDALTFHLQRGIQTQGARW